MHMNDVGHFGVSSVQEALDRLHDEFLFELDNQHTQALYEYRCLMYERELQAKGIPILSSIFRLTP